MSHNLTVESGSSVRLPTAGKYCDRDIVITATGSDSEPVIRPLEITENGTYTAPNGVDGYSPVTVTVPVPSGYIKPSGIFNVTENGAFDITEYATVLVNVATGGGGDDLPSGILAIDSGTFTPTEDYTSGVMVKHNLGVIPNFFLWWLEDDVSATTMTSIAITGGLVKKYAKYTAASSIVYNIRWFVEGYSSSSQQSGTLSRVSNETYMTSTECRMHTNSTYPIKSGYTYHWVCGVVDGVA